MALLHGNSGWLVLVHWGRGCDCSKSVWGQMLFRASWVAPSSTWSESGPESTALGNFLFKIAACQYNFCFWSAAQWIYFWGVCGCIHTLTTKLWIELGGQTVKQQIRFEIHIIVQLSWALWVSEIPCYFTEWLTVASCCPSWKIWAVCTAVRQFLFCGHKSAFSGSKISYWDIFFSKHVFCCLTLIHIRIIES